MTKPLPPTKLTQTELHVMLYGTEVSFSCQWAWENVLELCGSERNDQTYKASDTAAGDWGFESLRGRF